MHLFLRDVANQIIFCTFSLVSFFESPNKVCMCKNMQILYVRAMVGTIYVKRNVPLLLVSRTAAFYVKRAGMHAKNDTA